MLRFRNKMTSCNHENTQLGRIMNKDRKEKMTQHGDRDNREEARERHIQTDGQKDRQTDRQTHRPRI